MRNTALLMGIFLLAAAMTLAQQPAPLINPDAGVPAPAGEAADLPANASVDQVLDALDQRGKSLREFTAKVSLTKGDKFAGDLSTSVGKLWFQKKGNDGDGRLRVTFDKRIDGKVTRPDKTEYLLDNGVLVDRDYHKNSETRRQVAKPGEKTNLLKLGEGPFPLPIGQSKDDVKKLFDVALVPPDKQDPPGTIHITLTPKPQTHFSRHFGKIDVWVDRKTNFPVRIDTVAPDGSAPQTTKLEDVKINPQPPLGDADFTLPKIDPGSWSLHTEPYRD